MSTESEPTPGTESYWSDLAEQADRESEQGGRPILRPQGRGVRRRAVGHGNP